MLNYRLYIYSNFLLPVVKIHKIIVLIRYALPTFAYKRQVQHLLPSVLWLCCLFCANYHSKLANFGIELLIFTAPIVLKWFYIQILHFSVIVSVSDLHAREAKFQNSGINSTFSIVGETEYSDQVVSARDII